LSIKQNKTFEQKHGTIMCIGYGLGKFYRLIRESGFDLAAKYHDDINELVGSIGEKYFCY
jgi:hypothetical protein